jgi:hypothetical protein
MTKNVQLGERLVRARLGASDGKVTVKSPASDSPNWPRKTGSVHLVQGGGWFGDTSRNSPATKTVSMLQCRKISMPKQHSR